MLLGSMHVGPTMLSLISRMFVSLLVGLVVSCLLDIAEVSASEPSTQPTSRPQATSLPATKPSSKTTMSIVRRTKQGKKPLLLLRYVFKQGTTYSVRIDTHVYLDMTVRSDGRSLTQKQNLPSLRVLAFVSCVKVYSSGNALLRGTIRNSEVLQSPDSNSELRKSINKDIRLLKKLKLQYLVSSTGRLLQFSVSGVSRFSPSFVPVLRNVRQAFRRWVTPLPSKPLGVGGKWAVSSIAQKPIVASSIWIYSLKKRKKRVLFLDVKVGESSGKKRFNIRSPLGPRSVTLSTDAMGQGKLVLNLKGLGVRMDLNQVVQRKIRPLPSSTSRPSNVKQKGMTQSFPVGHISVLSNRKTYLHSFPIKKRKPKK